MQCALTPLSLKSERWLPFLDYTAYKYDITNKKSKPEESELLQTAQREAASVTQVVSA